MPFNSVLLHPAFAGDPLLILVDNTFAALGWQLFSPWGLFWVLTADEGFIKSGWKIQPQPLLVGFYNLQRKLATETLQRKLATETLTGQFKYSTRVMWNEAFWFVFLKNITCHMAWEWNPEFGNCECNSLSSRSCAFTKLLKIGATEIEHVTTLSVTACQQWCDSETDAVSIQVKYL